MSSTLQHLEVNALVILSPTGCVFHLSKHQESQRILPRVTHVNPGLSRCVFSEFQHIACVTPRWDVGGVFRTHPCLVWKGRVSPSWVTLRYSLSSFQRRSAPSSSQRRFPRMRGSSPALPAMTMGQSPAPPSCWSLQVKLGFPTWNTAQGCSALEMLCSRVT